MVVKQISAMKKIFAICLFSAFVLTVCGRNAVSFAYDAAGNRVKREIVMSRN